MADEISISFNAQITNTNVLDTINPGSLQIDQSAVGRGGHVQKIGVAAEVVDIGDIAVNGVLYLRNLDETNYVVFGPADTAGTSIEEFGKLKPGEFSFLRMAPSVVLWAIADTGECKLDVRLYED